VNVIPLNPTALYGGKPTSKSGVDQVHKRPIIYVCIYFDLCIRVCVLSYIYQNIHVCTVYINEMHVHIYIHIYICIYINVYIYISS
jgi:hypothetical protein